MVAVSSTEHVSLTARAKKCTGVARLGEKQSLAQNRFCGSHKRIQIALVFVG